MIEIPNCPGTLVRRGEFRLARYFGNSAQCWIGLQGGHDLWIASRSKTINKIRPRAQAA